MRFRLYREYGALNSGPVFDAFERGVKSLGHEISTGNDGIPVIWSVLWSGRMAGNKIIYERAKKQGMPVVIIEVGNLFRNRTWRLSLDNINGHGVFANDFDLDQNRPQKLGVKLGPIKNNRRPEILIAAQHQKSLQWQGMPAMNLWVEQTVKEIRKYSDRKILIRPHPRSPFSINLPNTQMLLPKMVKGSYDDFDIDYNYHCIVNHNSGPAVQGALHGTPVICHSSSLASKLSKNLPDIENITLPDREQWFLELTHTEWTPEEISTGQPLARLLTKIS